MIHLRLSGAICALAVLACSFWNQAEGARITLINGEVLEGEIIDESVTSVTVKTLSHTMTIPRNRIGTLDEGTPWSTPIYQAHIALANSDLKLADALVRTAREKGAPDTDLADIIEQLNAEKTRRELARYQETIDQARIAFSSGREKDALDAMEGLLSGIAEDSPARPEVVRILCDFHLGCAKEYRDRVQGERAVSELRRVLELDPTRVSAYVDLGDIYSNSTATWPQAIEFYRKALEIGEGKLDKRVLARIHWQMGEIFRQQQDWRGAAIGYRSAYLTDKTINVRLTDRLLESFEKFAEELRPLHPEGALSVLDEGLAIRNDPNLLYLKGMVLSRLDRHKEAIETFGKLTDLSQRRKGVYYQIAQNYFALGEIIRGRETLLREIALYPDNYEALCLLGDYALQRDDFEAAQGFYQNARSFDPDKARAWLGLGKAHRQKSHQLEDEEQQKAELRQAKEAVEQVLARLRTDREANLEMGRILRDEKNFKEASDYFTTVLDSIDAASPEEQVELRELRADALIARGEIKLLTAGPGTANKDFQSVLTELPGYAQAYYSIGRAYRKKYSASKNLDDLKVAEENLLKAIDLQAENAQFALELGILYQQELAQVDRANEKEYLDKAAHFYQQYIDLGGANAPQVRQWIKEIKN